MIILLTCLLPAMAAAWEHAIGNVAGGYYYIGNPKLNGSHFHESAEGVAAPACGETASCRTVRFNSWMVGDPDIALEDVILSPRQFTPSFNFQKLVGPEARALMPGRCTSRKGLLQVVDQASRIWIRREVSATSKPFIRGAGSGSWPGGRTPVSKLSASKKPARFLLADVNSP
jgi:hypothetical protein